MIDTDYEKRLQGALLRIRGAHPFFGTLALFAQFIFGDKVETAATDGKTIWINPKFVEGLDHPAYCGLVVHELLHAALLHGQRRRERDALLWNIAADVVVNGIVRSGTEYSLPEGGVEMPDLAHLSVEEVYELLVTGKKKAPSLYLIDLMQSDGNSVIEQDQRTEIERHWRAALQQATAVATRTNRGYGKDGLDQNREINEAASPSLNWREILWQFLVSTPCDFGGFDRRFVWQKLYIEDVVGESVHVCIAIDTSGSVSGALMQEFIAEATAILDSYPHINGHLFYADAEIYGPYNFGRGEEIPKAKGGGGTSFVPFFNWVNQHLASGFEPLCIYLTDGYGEFPKEAPEVPVLWVVCGGGLGNSHFPFGEVVRMGV